MLVVFGLCLIIALVCAIILIACGIEYDIAYFKATGLLLFAATAACLVLH